MFSLSLHHFLTLSTLWKEMGMVEKEGGLSVFDTDILNTFFFLPTAEITAQLSGKISAHLSIAEGLISKMTAVVIEMNY